MLRRPSLDEQMARLRDWRLYAGLGACLLIIAMGAIWLQLRHSSEAAIRIWVWASPLLWIIVGPLMFRIFPRNDGGRNGS